MLAKNRLRPRGQDEGGKDGNPSWVTHLYIPWDVSDVGNRPLAAGTSFWKTPYIDFSPKDSVEKALPGQPTTLSVTIRNDGYADAVGVTIEWVVCLPGIGGLVPALGDPFASVLKNVSHGPPTTFYCPTPWFPDFSMGAHQCLIARCSMPGDSLNPIYAFSAAQDAHVGQRNLDIHDPAAAGGSPKKLRLIASNPYAEAMAFEVRARVLWVRGAFDVWPKANAGGLAQFLAGIAVDNASPSPLEQQMHLSVHDVTFQAKGPVVTAIEGPQAVPRHRLIHPQDSLAARVGQSLGEPDGERRGESKAIGEIALAPSTMSCVDLLIPGDVVAKNETYVYHVTQESNGLVVGGYTIVVIRAR